VRRRALRGLLLLPALALSGHSRAVFLACEQANGTTVPCRIWLVPADGLSPLIPLAGGERTETAPGRYFVRAESSSGVLAAPAAVTITESGAEAKEVPDRIRLRPGARVAIPRELLADGGALHILSLETGAIETVFLSQRRFTTAPAGRVIAVGLSGPNRIAGITRSFVVRDHGVDVPGFSPPSRSSGHVVLSWQFPSGVSDDGNDLSPVLRSGKAVLRPFASRFDGGRSHWAVFYDVPAGTWRADAGSHHWRADPTEVTVTDNGISFPEPIPLRTLPSVSLRLERPDGLREDPFSVRLLKVDGDDCAPARIEAHLLPEVDADSVTVVAERTGIVDLVRLDAVEPGCYVAIFDCRSRRAHALVSMGDSDTEVTGVLSRIAITGTLKWAGTGGPGRIRFTHLNDRTVEDEVEAGPDGSFNAVVWQPGTFSVRIAPVDDGPGATKLLAVPRGVESKESDFDIPAAVFRYRFVDAVTASPIPEASLCCLPALEDEMARPVSDAEGRVRFRLSPPARSGSAALSASLALKVTAEGYESEDIRIAGGEPPVKETTIGMRKREDGEEIRVALPDGSPAGGAAVVSSAPGSAADDLARTKVIRCDQDGAFRLPRKSGDGEVVAIVHAGAGVTAATAGELRTAGSIRLLPASGSLEVQVERGPEALRQQVSLVLVLRGREVPVAALEMANLVGGAPGQAGAQRDPGGDPLIRLRASLLPAGAARALVVSRTPGSAGPSRAVTAPVDVFIPFDREIATTTP